MIARWLSALEMYTFKIQHHAGSHHCNADGLSRKPTLKDDCPDCVIVTISSSNLKEKTGSDKKLVPYRLKGKTVVENKLLCPN